jgi:hypothetical protein
MFTVVMSDEPVVPVPPIPVTVSVAVAETVPPNPFIVAVMVVVPGATPVARPEESIVATAGTLEVHVTWLVMFCVDAEWDPCEMVPVAVNCAVWFTAADWLVGVTVIVSTKGLPHPAMGTTQPISKSNFKSKRLNIKIPWLSSRLGAADSCADVWRLMNSLYGFSYFANRTFASPVMLLSS